MQAFLPPAAAAPWDGTALAGAALYLLLFGFSLWGTWALVRRGPGCADVGPSDPAAGSGPPAGSGGEVAPPGGSGVEGPA